MILFVSSDFIPHVGGKSTHIIDLRAGIGSLGEESLLYSQTQLSKHKRTALKLLISPLKLVDPKLFQYVYGLMWHRVLAKRVLKISRKYKLSCISCQDAAAAASLKAMRDRIDCKIVLTMHTYFGLENSLDSDKRSRLHDYIYRKNMQFEVSALEAADRIVAVDDRILNHVFQTIKDLKGEKRITAKECVSIENFTNTDTYRPGSKEEKDRLRGSLGITKDSFVIICARRLVEKNGVVHAVEAMKHLQENALLVIAGDGPQKAAVIRLIENEHLQTKVKMLGAVDPKKIVSYYKMADCSVVPSVTVNGLQEATSISALEAMACGLPTVASGIGGLVQIIQDGYNGFLVQEGESTQIAAALKKLLDEDLRNEMALNARKSVVENHSHINAAKAYMRIFLS